MDLLVTTYEGYISIEVPNSSLTNVDFSFNKIYNNFDLLQKEIGNMLRVIYIQLDNIKLFEHFVNKRLIQKNGKNFLLSKMI